MERGRRTGSLLVGLVLAGVLLSAQGCHQITEYQSGGESRVTMIKISDLAVESTMDGLEEGRSICSTDADEFLVASSSGRLYRVNSEQMSVDTSYRIGSSGLGGGYRSMIKVPGGRRIYVVDAAGKILDINLYSNQVVDQFEVGPAPTAMCPSQTGLMRVYVVDGSDNRLREIDTEDNRLVRERELGYRPVGVAAFDGGRDYLGIVSSESSGSYEVFDTQDMYGCRVYTGSPCGEVRFLPDSVLACVTQPQWGSSAGLAAMISGYVPTTEAVLEMPGNPVCLCVHPQGDYFFVACASGGETVVAVIDPLTLDVIKGIAVEGYPWDVTTHRSGQYLLVLTAL
jgi:YVTN family beta-propeller protein